MKKSIFFLLLFLPLGLLASKILSYNIYDRTDRADVMLTFDTPYNGVIRQHKSDSKIIIKLEGASIESPKIKKVSSQYLRSLTITPLKNKTQIIAIVPKNVKLVASKTADAYGLRLRFIDKNSYKKNTQTTSNTSNSFASTLPTKKSDDLSKSYYIVIAILVIGIGILLYIRKKLPAANNKKSTKDAWLFQPNTQEKNTPTAKQSHQESLNSNQVTIRFQKAIDEHNSVVMIDFGNQSYLVLMGNGNILLDKFIDDKPTSQQEFETILQNRHEELEEFLNGGQRSHKTSSFEAQEALEAYKEKAASSIYDTV